jgi:hypothetical protein
VPSILLLGRSRLRRAAAQPLLSAARVSIQSGIARTVSTKKPWHEDHGRPQVNVFADSAHQHRQLRTEPSWTSTRKRQPLCEPVYKRPVGTFHPAYEIEAPAAPLPSRMGLMRLQTDSARSRKNAPSASFAITERATLFLPLQTPIARCKPAV